MGILKNTFGKKTEVESPLILSMPMFKGDSGYSLEKVIEDLKSYWGLTVDQIEGDDTTASFEIGEECVVIALMPAPIPAEEFESMYSYSYLWEDAEQEIKEHTQHAIVSILGSSTSALKRYSILSKVNASILRTSETAIGVYQGASTLLLPKDFYIDLADLLLEDLLPVQLWVYIGIINNNDKTGLYTYGMKEFGKSEIEIIDTSMESDDAYVFLLTVLQYIIEQDVTLQHGETIGLTEDQKIKITESKAIYLDGNSLKLEL
mgnify:CR=1 FL=1